MAGKIMVVNDTQEILDLFREVLEEDGYEVDLYSFSIRDLDTLVKSNPDLIILDLMFGNENLGWQLLQKMKMSRQTARIPVIICTAATQAVREIEGHLKAMGVALVPKPFDIDYLLIEVRRALAIPKLPDDVVLGEE